MKATINAYKKVLDYANRVFGEITFAEITVKSWSTREEAVAALATLPKSIGLRVGTITNDEGTRFQLFGNVSFKKDGVNGGVNENGIKRLGRWLALMECVAGDGAMNSATTEEIAALVS